MQATRNINVISQNCSLFVTPSRRKNDFPVLRWLEVVEVVAHFNSLPPPPHDSSSRSSPISSGQRGKGAPPHFVSYVGRRPVDVCFYSRHTLSYMGERRPYLARTFLNIYYVQLFHTLPKASSK